MSTTDAGVTDEEVVDAYLYLLARFIVLRQENLDINIEKVGYNTIKYNPLASAAFVNPNIDVAYLEAWIAVDPEHAVIMNVPTVTGRYYTVEILDGWGEVIDNINGRTHPEHPSGQVAFAMSGTTPPIPDGALRVDLPAAKAKVLARVELRDDPDGAISLQHQFTLDVPTGIVTDAPLVIPNFTNADLIGPEIFELAAGVLATYPDSMPSAAEHQAVAARVAVAMASEPAHDTDRRRRPHESHPGVLRGSEGLRHPSWRLVGVVRRGSLRRRHPRTGHHQLRRTVGELDRGSDLLRRSDRRHWHAPQRRRRVPRPLPCRSAGRHHGQCLLVDDPVLRYPTTTSCRTPSTDTTSTPL